MFKERLYDFRLNRGTKIQDLGPGIYVPVGSSTESDWTRADKNWKILNQLQDVHRSLLRTADDSIDIDTYTVTYRSSSVRK